MSEFRANIVAELDTSKVESKINDLNGRKIKLEVDNKAEKGITSLRNSISNTSKTATSFGTTVRQALNIGSAAAVMAKSFQLIGNSAQKAKEAIKDFDSAIKDIYNA